MLIRHSSSWQAVRYAASLVFGCLCAATMGQSASSSTAGLYKPESLETECLQPGVTATFYDLTADQSRGLSDQFPFIHGRGELLDSLRRSEQLLLPQINFASFSNPGGTPSRGMTTWPRPPPPNSNGSVIVFDAYVDLIQSGYWTFFVTANGPFELHVLLNGSLFEASKNGGTPLWEDGAIVGLVSEATYKLPEGPVQIQLEYHVGVQPGSDPEPIIALEWASTRDPDDVPSNNLPQIVRQVVGPRYLKTACWANSFAPVPAPNDQDDIPNMVGVPRPAMQAAFLAAPEVAQKLQVPSPAPSPGREGNCKAAYMVSQTWRVGELFAAVVTLELTSEEGTLEAPYTVEITSPAYTEAVDAFNLQDGAFSSGTYIGIARADWQTLNTYSPATVGAIFESSESYLGPVSVAVDGVDCELSPA